MSLCCGTSSGQHRAPWSVQPSVCIHSSATRCGRVNVAGGKLEVWVQTDKIVRRLKIHLKIIVFFERIQALSRIGLWATQRVVGIYWGRSGTVNLSFLLNCTALNKGFSFQFWAGISTWRYQNTGDNGVQGEDLGLWNQKHLGLDFGVTIYSCFIFVQVSNLSLLEFLQSLRKVISTLPRFWEDYIILILHI